jgi:AcrR family transcriptional regulator
MAPSNGRRAAHRPREERIADILVAAREVFSEHGFEAASMADIAERVGISEPAVYKYFKSKRHLLLSVIREWYLGMIAENRRKLEGVQGIRARVQLLVWQHLKTIRDASELCRLFYAEVRSRPDYAGSELHRLNREATSLLTSVLEEGVAAGELRPDLPLRLVRDIVYGGIEHHVSAFLSGRGQLDCDQIASDLTSLVFDGLGTGSTHSATQQAVHRLERVTKRLETLLRPRAA